MKLLIAAAAFLSVAIAARYADAEPKKPAKPVVCAAYSVAKADSGPVAICYDNKKPFILSSFAEVSVPGADGGSVTVLVGWR